MKRILFIIFIFTTFLLSKSVQIMPLGDSITHGHPNGYRDDLWYKLKDSRYDVNFVGSQHNGSGFDDDHEGYDYAKTYDIEQIVYGLLQDNPPDIILLHIGSNDVSPTQGTNSSSVSGLDDILDEIDKYENNYNHPIRVILATIINRRTYHQTVVNYNNNLRNLANYRKNNGDIITLIDMENNAGLNSSDFADATHPNNSGYYKMSKVWFRSLDKLLPAPSTVPEKPSNVYTSSIEHDSVTLKWNDSSDNEQGFKIYRGTTLVATLGENITRYTIHNLTPNTHYTYSVVSYIEDDSDPASVTFTTKDDYAWLPAVYHVILN